MTSTSPRTVDTPSLQRLRAGEAPEAVSEHWPVVDAALAGNWSDDVVPVTFAAYAPAGHEVLVHINGLVDRSRTDFAWALLPVVSVGPDGREVHAQSYLLPKGMLSTYRLVVQARIPRDAGSTQPGWKAIHEAGGPDPLNPCPSQPTPLGGDASTLVLPGGPALHSAWADDSAPALTERALTEREIAPGVGLLDTGRRDRLAVVFDAEQWRDVGLEAAVARLGNTCPSVLLIDSFVPDGVGAAPRSRPTFLPDADAVAYVVESAVAALRAGGEGDGWGALTREGILATGQSFGGLAAVGAVALTGWAGAALAQSASLHYVAPVPGAPRVHRAEGLGTLMRRIESAGPSERPGRIDLVAGTLEAGLLQVAEQAAPVLNAQRHQTSVRSRVGGHDYAWWRHELLNALEEFGRTAPAGAQSRV
ncbi:MAG: enterochelin esterase domain-containing protein [Galactobacter sp.]